jgi:hypothetical protein
MPNQWSVQHTPAAATQATITKAAAAGFRHVCDSITATLACAGTAQTPIQVVLRDGLTGAGAILWSAKLAAPVNGMADIEMEVLGIPGTSGNAMTLEFTGAGVAASEQCVAMVGYDIVSS